MQWPCLATFESKWQPSLLVPTPLSGAGGSQGSYPQADACGVKIEDVHDPMHRRRCLDGVLLLGSSPSPSPKQRKQAFHGFPVDSNDMQLLQGAGGGEGRAGRKLPNFTKWGPAGHHQVKLRNFPPARGGRGDGGEPRAVGSWALDVHIHNPKHSTYG